MQCKQTDSYLAKGLAWRTEKKSQRKSGTWAEKWRNCWWLQWCSQCCVLLLCISHCWKPRLSGRSRGFPRDSSLSTGMTRRKFSPGGAGDRQTNLQSKSFWKRLMTDLHDFVDLGKDKNQRRAGFEPNNLLSFTEAWYKPDAAFTPNAICASNSRWMAFFWHASNLLLKAYF